MKKLIFGTALAMLWALTSAGSASAQVTGTEKDCEAKILDRADKYSIALRAQIEASVKGNIVGKSVKADGGKICFGGSTPGVKGCQGNNGGCADGARKLLSCDSNADCPGVCKNAPTLTCTSYNDAAELVACGANKVCAGFGKGCLTTKGCSGGLCEVNQNDGIAKAIAKASKDLRNNIVAKCTGVNFHNLGLPNAECKAKCSDGVPCVVDADCSLGTCDTAIDDITDCIQHGQTGDLRTAVSGDALTRTLTRVAPNIKPRGAGPLNKNPRKRSTVALPNLIQIGTVTTSDGAGSAGSSSPTSLARCAGAGAKNGIPCIEDADCAGPTGGIKVITASPPNNTAQCVSDCCDCSAVAGSCTTPGTVSAVGQGFCTGVAGETVCETRGNIVPPGNLLGSPTENQAGIIQTCLVTKLGRIAQATAGIVETDKGHCNVTVATSCDVDTDCPGGEICRGGLSSFGAINLNTGVSSTKAPIATDVYLTGSSAASICPECSSLFCNDVPGGPVGCTASDGNNDEACLPYDDGGPHWQNIATIPNPFDLKSGTTSITAVGGKFCGACTATVGGKHIYGCSMEAPDECTAAGLGTCVDHFPSVGTPDFTTVAGFRNDPLYDDNLTLAGQQATSTGIPNLYAGVAAGLFCTGSSGNPLVDPAAGLPGPVRVVAPYIVNWTFSTK
ncbi:MAG: hypothetical protein HYR72_23330 [Deltaproteobacteria bacterium]|nr:hypothetical protein [Deltaproteobacteria bacterium]MBI3389032.1 hypothetical protein [Deltaproteobacteria bacterium]